MTVLATQDSMPIIIQDLYFFAWRKPSRSSSEIPGGRGPFPAGKIGAVPGRLFIAKGLLAAAEDGGQGSRGKHQTRVDAQFSERVMSAGPSFPDFNIASN